MSDEEIIYQYYLKLNIKSRNEAIELLKKRDFDMLHQNYGHWYIQKENIVKLNSTSITDVIKELSNIKVQENESEPFLSCCFDEFETMFGTNTESSIEIISYIYTVMPFEKCKTLAKLHTNSSLWKLKNQPNSKGAELYRKIIYNESKQK